MRSRYKARDRERLIEAVRSTGEPVKAVAEQMGVSVSTAYLWMKRARAGTMKFARLVPAAQVASAGIVVEVGGAAIRLTRGFDADLLLEVVEALGRTSS